MKIGISLNVTERMHGLQTPELMKVYAVIDGWAREEAELHHRFEKYRLRGEWFRHEGELADWIKGGYRYPAKQRVSFKRLKATTARISCA